MYDVVMHSMYLYFLQNGLPKYMYSVFFILFYFSFFLHVPTYSIRQRHFILACIKNLFYHKVIETLLKVEQDCSRYSI